MAALTPRDWENEFVFQGWVLSVEEPVRQNGRLAYRLRVGFSAEEAIDVMAFRGAHSEKLKPGAVARVKGLLRFLPDETGITRVRLDAKQVEIVQLAPEGEEA